MKNEESAKGSEKKQTPVLKKASVSREEREERVLFSGGSLWRASGSGERRVLPWIHVQRGSLGLRNPEG